MGDPHPLRAGPDVAVSIAYRLFDAAGSLQDTVPSHAPLRYVHGYAQVLPGLEDGLTGCELGEERVLELAPEDAFGEPDQSARLVIDRHDLPGAAEVSVGDEVIAEGSAGACAYRVVATTDQQLTLDLNHPLAGQLVRFEVEVVELREATDEEITAAQADMQERIVYDGAIDYGTDHDCDATPQQPSLLKLRKKPAGGAEKKP